MSTSSPDPNSPDPNYFVDIPITTDGDVLADNAVEVLRASWVDWEPADGDPEIIAIEAIAPMMANAASVAALMPLTALATYGSTLLGVPVQPGEPATTTVLFTFEDDVNEYTIPAGAQMGIDGFAFATAEDLTGTGTVDGEVVAAEDSATYNGLTGGVSVVPITMPTFVTGMSVDAPTANGLDPQSPQQYVSDLSQELQLTIRTITTLVDFEIAATTIDGILRAHAVTDAARDVSVWLLSTAGGAVSTELKDALSLAYQGNAVVNVTAALEDPTISQVSVVWAATIYQGWDPTDFTNRANAALAQELSTTGWGMPPAGDPGSVATLWYSNPIVKAARLSTVLSQVQGIYDVTSVQPALYVPGALSAALSTGAPITTLHVEATGQDTPAGSEVMLTDPTGVYTQGFTTTADAATGSTTIPVASRVPNYAYPVGTNLGITLPAGQDLTMPGAVPLPTPGNFVGTVTLI